MDTEELDPDLILDMPSHGEGMGMGMELGAGFGNEISSSDSLDDEDPSFGTSEAFSTPLRKKSSNRLDGGGSFAEELEAGGSQGAGGGGGFGGVRQSRGAGATPSSNRLSLAFELAAAMSPAPNRSVLDELGIEEEDEDEGGEGRELEAQGEGEGDDIARKGGVSASEARLMGVERGSSEGVPSRDYGSRPDEEDDDMTGAASTGGQSLLSTPGPRRNRPSMASLLSTPDDSSDLLASPGGINEESFTAAASSLEDSLHTTDVFLSHLRAHTLDSKDNQRNPPSSSTRHTTTTTNGKTEEQASFTDRQPVVEQLAGDMIKQIYELASQREGQVRELKEIERQFARNDLEWQSILAELEDLPEAPPKEEEEDAAAAQGEPSSNAASRSRDGHLDVGNGTITEEDENEMEDGSRTPTSPLPSNGGGVNGFDRSHSLDDSFRTPPTSSDPFTSRFPDPDADPTSSASQSNPRTTLRAQEQLSNLKKTTSSLIATLSSINEHSQVNNAATGDAGRKLKSLKTVMSNWKTELEGLERSRKFISEWEEAEERADRQAKRAAGVTVINSASSPPSKKGGEGTSAAGAGAGAGTEGNGVAGIRRRGRYSDQALAEVRAAEKALGEAGTKAGLLLTSNA